MADLAREFGLGPSSTVLDLATGTGKLTRELVAHAGRVIAVEPSAAMLHVLRERLPGVDARAGTARGDPSDAATVRHRVVERWQRRVFVRRSRH